MAKKAAKPTQEQIRKAYIEVYLRRKPDPEGFAKFTEVDMADFIRRYVAGRFEGIYRITDHNFYDLVRNKIATNSDMNQEDVASNLSYSVHLRTYSNFLESNAFKKLTNRKINIEDDLALQDSDSEQKTEQGESEKPKYKEEAEGVRKHVMKEMDVIYRNPKLRQDCIDKFGFQCQCCGMDFTDCYGEELGAYFIEVHHLRPISTFEKDGVPENFLENLVPLCSNCHSMIHHIADSEHPLRDLRQAYKGERKIIKIWKED